MTEAAPLVAPAADPVKRYLLRNPAVAVTLAYLLLTAIGVTFSFLHYQRFGISIFDYWQPSDLVLAGFREPASFFYAAVMAAIWWNGYRDQVNRAATLKEHAARYAAMSTDGALGWWVRLNRKLVQDALDMVEGRSVPFNLGWYRRWSQVLRANVGVTYAVVGCLMYVYIAFMHVWVRQYMVALWFPAVEVVATDARVYGAGGGPQQFLIGSSNGFLFLATEGKGDHDEGRGAGRGAGGREVTIIPVTSVISFRTYQALSWAEFYGSDDP